VKAEWVKAGLVESGNDCTHGIHWPHHSKTEPSKKQPLSKDTAYSPHTPSTLPQ